ncbi:hypothetical protein U1Q18_027753 [Sarracenia purpurea var. burkii]
MSDPVSFLLLLFSTSIFFFFFPTTSDGSDALSANCPSHQCGEVEIKYPFWLMTEPPLTQYCGYPSFNLSCSTTNETIFNLPTDSYYVKSINYTNFSVALVDIDITTSQTCSRARDNVTIQTLPLSYNPLDLNLSFYFNCSGLPTVALPIECLSSGENHSYVFVVGTEPAVVVDDWSYFCEEKVVVTVMDSEIDQTNGLISGFDGAMKSGFLLDWRTVAGCGGCEASDGRCGYNSVTEEFLCFCADGTARTNRCKGTRFLFGLIL